MRVKCKKCKKKFKGDDIQAQIDSCDKHGCILRLRNIPVTVIATAPAANEDVVIESYEEIPINGFISRKELMKNGKAK